MRETYKNHRIVLTVRNTCSRHYRLAEGGRVDITHKTVVIVNHSLRRESKDKIKIVGN